MHGASGSDAFFVIPMTITIYKHNDNLFLETTKGRYCLPVRFKPLKCLFTLPSYYLIYITVRPSANVQDQNNFMKEALNNGQP